MFLISLDISVIDILIPDLLRKSKRMCESLVHEVEADDRTTIAGEIQ
jgi:hypothetical protein